MADKDFGDDGHQAVGAVFTQQVVNTLLGQQHGTDLGVEVAEEVLGLPDIGGKHPEEVVTGDAAVVELEGRDADALLEDFVGAGVVAAVGAASDVAVVGAVDAVEEQSPFVKDGADDGDVGEVAAAEIGVVEDEEVSFVDVVAEVVADGGAGDGEGADVHGDALALGDELAVAVEDGGGEVAAGVEDLGHGGAEHGLGHFLGDGLQAVLDDGEGDGVSVGRSEVSVDWGRDGRLGRDGGLDSRLRGNDGWGRRCRVGYMVA